jgi:hypothetical protein
MLGRRKAKHLALLRQAVDPILIPRMRADDGQLQASRQLTRAARVVDVGVGEPNLRQLETALADLGQQAIQLTTWINDSSLPGLVAPNNRAILSKWGDGDGVVLQHKWHLKKTRLLRLSWMQLVVSRRSKTGESIGHYGGLIYPKGY